ncbi:MAG: hypothetical protein ACR2HD_06655 [Solirubrobacteraceae bacterium]
MQRGEVRGPARRAAGPGLRALRGQLGSAPPKGVRALDDEALAQLADAIHGARRRQAAALETAGKEALDHIPALLRGAVRRMLR